MRRVKSLILLTLMALTGLDLRAQEAVAGVAMPVTLTGGAILASRLPESESDTGASGAMFRATVYPSLKLSTRWFAYSALQISFQPGSSYNGGSPDQRLQTSLLQALVGYIWTGPGRSLTLKAGKLSSAFGSFSLRYDDMVNPLRNSPLSYGAPLPIRADQLPCGVRDFLDERGSGYGTGQFTGVHFRCGGAKAVSSGLFPVGLSGLPGAQIEVALRKVDARFQIANSSPANPQSLLSSGQALQWVAGAGYTIKQGFRVGFSMHRGPFLDSILTNLLPDNTRIADYPATGLGTDLQWSRGRWNLEAEWQRFQYNYPRFVISPAVCSGYGEITRTLTPRFYAAVRISYQHFNQIADLRISTDQPFQPNRQTWEFAIGYRPNSRQLIKAGYARLEGGAASPAMPSSALAVQLVTSLPALSRSFR